MLILLAAASGCVSDLRDDETMAGRIIQEFNGEPVVPRSANRIFIPPPESAPGLEYLAPLLLDNVRRAVSLDGRLGVESEEKSADLRLDIRINKCLVVGMEYDEIGRAVRKRIWVTADVRLRDLGGRRTIFFERDIQAFRLFSDLAPPIEIAARAREYVLDELAKRIALKTVTGWYTDRMTSIEKGK
ncbi:MAG: hypothetical protein JW838_15945 [Spirochaetes bacterium]|nr:hypothetical protein [Spirochaetota bacterium]